MEGHDDDPTYDTKSAKMGFAQCRIATLRQERSIIQTLGHALERRLWITLFVNRKHWLPMVVPSKQPQ